LVCGSLACSSTVAAQSLPRELTLSQSGRLLQSWVPELQAMRAWAPEQHGLQLEVWARFSVSKPETSSQVLAATPRFGFSVLQVAGTDEATHVGVDVDVGIVFIDGRRSNSCDAIPWQCPHPQTHLTPPSPRAKGLYPAGPLFGSRDDIVIHCYVDAVFVSCIFNNETAITAMVAPSDKATAAVTSFGEGDDVRVTSLNTWRLALPGNH
jgi:sucrose-6-phosphate hydrolase SacC (GH32 family)